jgi:dTDP-4-amino-4,6-dideoxygalactose transaminase
VRLKIRRAFDTDRVNSAIPKLALDGGSPVRTHPLPTRIQFDDREREAVDRLFRAVARDGGNFDRYGPGPQAEGTALAQMNGRPSEVDLFERELAEFYGVRHVAALSSGSAAVLAALAALEMEPGTEVITSPLTDPGVVMGVLFLGCVPVFVDHDYDTIAVSPSAIQSAITERTGAIVVTHLMGLISDMDAIMRVARSHHVPVIGDSAQAHGACYGGSRSRPFGDIGAVSMMSTKHMTSGGQGGFIATDNEGYYLAAKRFADRGKPFGLPSPPEGAPHGGDRSTLGLNCRMHDLEAVVGRVQLTKLHQVMTARACVLRELNEGLAEVAGVKPVRIYDGTEPSPWGAVFVLDRHSTSVSVRRFAAAMTAEGIATVPLIPDMVPVIDELSFLRDQEHADRARYPYGYELRGRKVRFVRPEHPVIDRLANDLIVIWIHEGWGAQEIVDTLAALRKVASAYRVA